MHHIVGGWGFATNSTGELTALHGPLAGFKGPTSKALFIRERDGREREGRKGRGAKMIYASSTRNRRAVTVHYIAHGPSLTVK